MSIDLRKKAEEKLIDLSKKATITLSKKGLNGVTARVGLALDISASMTNLYKRGTVQAVTEQTLALGMNFDDNQAADVFLFGVKDYTVGEIQKENFYEFVNREIYSKYELEGGTRYSGVIRRIVEYYFPGAFTTKKSGFLGLKSERIVDTSKYQHQEPVYIIFITDGNCQDYAETKDIITLASRLGVFFQFVGVGDEQFTFLKELDDMEGRFIDNANFFQVRDMGTLSDGELYDSLLAEFPAWLKEARSKSIIK
ncbi:hypothetical protein J2Z69_001880 [Paenibacillus shirakamiensis]|uniref:VWFA domain-containing protein n=1 Tax=Paenibacillus shirakamiensis TaxID=1265935 RepID=A0ABS4JJR4_9BACL|nr:VWA domain-containing protein [Paenibacillus shirakamiensis]MBP2000849.1 hypothetical protein [Paenibacillus shirakamiensis]